MAEYIKIVGDDSNVIIDDSFRNVHLIAVKRVLGSTAQIKVGSNGDFNYFPPLFNVYGFVFNVTSLSRPVIAMAKGRFAGVRHKETSANQWEITIYVDAVADNMDTTEHEFFIYGVADGYTRVYGKHVVEVFNSANKCVFSSALSTMKVVDYYAGDIRNKVPNFFTRPIYDAYFRPIPNYSSSKRYAIVLVSQARDAWNMGAGGGILMYASRQYINTQGQSVSYLYNYSASNDQNNNLEIFIPALSYMVIDVTGL